MPGLDYPEPGRSPSPGAHGTRLPLLLLAMFTTATAITLWVLDYSDVDSTLLPYAYLLDLVGFGLGLGSATTPRASMRAWSKAVCVVSGSACVAATAIFVYFI